MIRKKLGKNQPKKYYHGFIYRIEYMVKIKDTMICCLRFPINEQWSG